MMYWETNKLQGKVSPFELFQVMGWGSFEKGSQYCSDFVVSSLFSLPLNLKT